MTELLREALRRLEDLSPSDQNKVAGAMIGCMDQLEGSRLTPEQWAEAERRMADPDQVLLSAEEVRQRLASLTR